MPKTLKKPAVIFVTIILLIALSALSFYFLNNKSNTDPNNQIVATFNGGNVKLIEAQAELRRLALQSPALLNTNFLDLTEIQQKLVIQETIIKKISAKKAIAKNLDQDQEFKVGFEIFKNELLRQSLMSHLVTKAQTEENLQEKYQEIVNSLKEKQDYRVRFISLESKKEADWLYKRLIKHPKSFAKYAKNKSLDKRTAEKGGDLGFILEDSLPAPVKAALDTVKQGQVTQPVKVGENWLLTKIEESRPAHILSYDEIKPQLKQKIAQEIIEQYITEVLAKAEINFSLNPTTK